MSRDASSFVFITYEYAMNSGSASGNAGRGNAQIYYWRNGTITQMTSFSGIDNVPFPAYPRFRDDGGRFFTYTRIQIGSPSQIRLIDAQTKAEYTLNVGPNASDSVVQLVATQKINEILGGNIGGQASPTVSSASLVKKSSASSAIGTVNTMGNCVCPKSVAFVCGQDGRTYINACDAQCKGVQVRSTGACPPATQKTYPPVFPWSTKFLR